MSNRNWICASCGRGFSKKFSAQRRINHVERGLSILVTKDEYELGIRTGALVPHFPRPTYRKTVHLSDLFGQKLKEKLADMLAEEELKNPEQRKLILAIFMNEISYEQTNSDDIYQFSKLVARKMGQFRTP